MERTLTLKAWIATLLCSCSALSYASSTTLHYTINGVQGAALKNAEARLAIINKDLSKHANPVVIRHTINNSINDIKQALEPYGYFHAKVRMHYQQKDNQWLVSYQVNLGKPIMISAINVTIKGAGQHDKAFIKLLKHLPLSAGDTLNTVKYDTIKTQLFDLASERGYFMAQMHQSHILINLRQNTAKITIRFNTGKRYVFGQVHFNKNRLAPSFLQRYVNFKPKKPYNNKKVQQLREDLINANYFHSVSVTPDIQHNNQVVPIDVELSPRKSRRYSIGLGFGTDTGPRALFGFKWIPVNQYGHTFNLNLRAAQKNNYYVASYTIPGNNPVTDQYNISGGYSTEQIPSGSAESKSFGISYTTIWHGWQQILSLRYLNERYNINYLPKTSSNMLVPSISWSYTHANRTLNPSNGYKIEFTLAGALKQAFSRNSFFQAKLAMKYLHTFNKTHSRLVMRSTIGHTVINNIVNLPLSLQLLAGGAQSVRGYSYHSIGPGKNIFVGSIELQQRVVGNWYVGAFYDVGTVSNKLFNHLRQGVGPALIWLSPVGALELSFGHALDKGGANWAIQFSMGPTL